MLRCGANDRRIEAGDDEVRVPTNENRIDDLFPRYVDHSDVSPTQRDEAQLSVAGNRDRLGRHTEIIDMIRLGRQRIAA